MTSRTVLEALPAVRANIIERERLEQLNEMMKRQYLSDLDNRMTTYMDRSTSQFVFNEKSVNGNSPNVTALKGHTVSSYRHCYDEIVDWPESQYFPKYRKLSLPAVPLCFPTSSEDVRF